MPYSNPLHKHKLLYQLCCNNPLQSWLLHIVVLAIASKTQTEVHLWSAYQSLELISTSQTILESCFNITVLGGDFWKYLVRRICFPFNYWNPLLLYRVQDYIFTGRRNISLSQNNISSIINGSEKTE